MLFTEKTQVVDLTAGCDFSDSVVGKMTVDFAQNSAVVTLHAAYDYAFGLGECYDAVNYKGRTRRTEVYEKFCEQGARTYFPVPFFFTGSGFGVFVDTQTVTDFEFGENEITISIRLDTAGKYPLMYIYHGMPMEIVKEFTMQTGKPALPPEWSVGVWISANRWDGEEKVYSTLARLEEYGLPADVLVLEAWSDEATFYLFRKTFGDPQKMIKKLHECGLKLVLWQAPVIKKLSGEESSQRHDEDWAYTVEHRLCVTREDGTPYTIPEGKWFPGSMIPDFTNPETVKWWFDNRRYLLELGVDGFKTDGGEFIYGEGLRFCDGRTEKEMKNAYASEYIRCFADFVGEDRVLFSRAGYVGQQRYPIQWAGDQKSTWEELRSVVCSALSCAMSGVSLWSFDIAGFAGNLPELELYERATQFAVFTPVMQWHSEPDGGQFGGGTQSNNERSPWNIAEVYGDSGLVERLRFHYSLRKSLQPYIYSLVKRYACDGTPIMQHLLLQFGDREFLAGSPCYLLGDLLIYPVLHKGQKTMEIFLPTGTWYDFFSGEAYNGGQMCEYALSAERIPVFVKNGCGIVLKDSEGLCLSLYGESGEYSFAEGEGMVYSARWKDGKVDCPDCRFRQIG